MSTVAASLNKVPSREQDKLHGRETQQQQRPTCSFCRLMASSFSLTSCCFYIQRSNMLSCTPCRPRAMETQADTRDCQLCCTMHCQVLQRRWYHVKFIGTLSRPHQRRTILATPNTVATRHLKAQDSFVTQYATELLEKGVHTASKQDRLP